MEENNVYSQVEHANEKDKEEVLFSYQCANEVMILVKLIISGFIIYIAMLKLFEGSLSIISILLIVIMILSVLWMIYHNLNNLMNRGFNITKTKLITFSGKKIPLEEVYYMFVTTPQGISSNLSFYQNKKFVLSCPIKKEDKDFIEFLKILSVVSDNSEINNEYEKYYYARTKLIKQKG